MDPQPGNGRACGPSSAKIDVRSIEIDLADVELPAELLTPDDLAVAAAHVYERFVPYADDGWEWLSYPGSRDFDGWLYTQRAGRRIFAGARLLSRRVTTDESVTTAPPLPGLSAHRTRRLPGR